MASKLFDLKIRNCLSLSPFSPARQTWGPSLDVLTFVSSSSFVIICLVNWHFRRNNMLLNFVQPRANLR